MRWFPVTEKFRVLSAMLFRSAVLSCTSTANSLEPQILWCRSWRVPQQLSLPSQYRVTSLWRHPASALQCTNTRRRRSESSRGLASIIKSRNIMIYIRRPFSFYNHGLTLCSEGYGLWSAADPIFGSSGDLLLFEMVVNAGLFSARRTNARSNLFI